MKEWHEQDYFWSELSDKMFTKEHWLLAENEVSSIINLLDIQQGNKILDLCCGPGRHSIEFAKRGYAVTGVDRTSSYIRKAQAQALKEGLNIDFIVEDMRKYHRFNEYDVILNLYTSFGYFSNPDDDKKVLDNVYVSLRHNGQFLIEMMGKEVLARIFLERSWYEKDGVIYLEERKIENGWRMINNKCTIIKDNKSKEFNYHQRLYSGVEISLLLDSVGFKSIKLFGDLKSSPYDNNAKRLVALASK